VRAKLFLFDVMENQTPSRKERPIHIGTYSDENERRKTSLASQLKYKFFKEPTFSFGEGGRWRRVTFS
jgi:hypothetical protein